MSRRKSIRSRKSYSLLAAVFRGLAVSAAVFFICSLVISTTDIPQKAAAFMGTVVLVSGGFAAGYDNGRRRRRHGIKCGVICGFVMAALFVIFSLFITGRVSLETFLKKAALLMLFSAAGGIAGVNGKMKKPPY
jgi:putative membrane protein (TIGR04086 family)